jgi:uncharacterized membrane protein YukC
MLKKKSEELLNLGKEALDLQNFLSPNQSEVINMYQPYSPKTMEQKAEMLNSLSEYL